MEPATRRLKMSEVPTAVDLVERFAKKQVTPEYIVSFLSNPINFLIVAEIEGEVVGFLLAHALQRLKQNSHKMFIYEIDVIEEHRRKGVGTALIEHILRIARSNKMMNAFVFTNYSNEAALALYTRTGGRIVNGDDVMFVYNCEPQGDVQTATGAAILPHD